VGDVDVDDSESTNQQSESTNQQVPGANGDAKHATPGGPPEIDSTSSSSSSSSAKGELVSGFNMPDAKKAEESRRLIWSATLGLPPKVDMKQVVFKPNVAVDLPANVPKWHTLNLPLCEMDSRELHLVCGGQADDAYCLVVRKHEQNMVRVVHWFLDPSRMHHWCESCTYLPLSHYLPDGRCVHCKNVMNDLFKPLVAGDFQRVEYQWCVLCHRTSRSPDNKCGPACDVCAQPHSRTVFWFIKPEETWHSAFRKPLPCSSQDGDVKKLHCASKDFVPTLSSVYATSILLPLTRHKLVPRLQPLSAMYINVWADESFRSGSSSSSKGLVKLADLEGDARVASSSSSSSSSSSVVPANKRHAEGEPADESPEKKQRVEGKESQDKESKNGKAKAEEKKGETKKSLTSSLVDINLMDDDEPELLENPEQGAKKKSRVRSLVDEQDLAEKSGDMSESLASFMNDDDVDDPSSSSSSSSSAPKRSIQKGSAFTKRLAVDEKSAPQRVSPSAPNLRGPPVAASSNVPNRLSVSPASSGGGGGGRQSPAAPLGGRQSPAAPLGGRQSPSDAKANARHSLAKSEERPVDDEMVEQVKRISVEEINECPDIEHLRRLAVALVELNARIRNRFAYTDPIVRKAARTIANQLLNAQLKRLAVPTEYKMADGTIERFFNGAEYGNFRDRGIFDETAFWRAFSRDFGDYSAEEKRLIIKDARGSTYTKGRSEVVSLVRNLVNENFKATGTGGSVVEGIVLGKFVDGEDDAVPANERKRCEIGTREFEAALVYHLMRLAKPMWRTVRVTINDEARKGLLSAVAGCLHTHWTNRRGVPLSVALQSLPEAITKKNSNGKDSKGK
jgi:hypothetical protein